MGQNHIVYCHWVYCNIWLDLDKEHTVRGKISEGEKIGEWYSIRQIFPRQYFKYLYSELTSCGNHYYNTIQRVAGGKNNVILYNWYGVME